MRSPASGGSSPARILSSVDLPAPFGPIRPTFSPARRSRDRPENNGRGPKLLVRLCTLNRTAMLSSPGPRFALIRAVDLRLELEPALLGLGEFGRQGDDFVVQAQRFDGVRRFQGPGHQGALPLVELSDGTLERLHLLADLLLTPPGAAGGGGRPHRCGPPALLGFRRPP